MKQMTNAVTFNSCPEFWAKEMDGRTNEISRVIETAEWDWLLTERPDEISIVNTDTEGVFTREICDMRKMREMDGDRCEVLITWRHPQCGQPRTDGGRKQ